MKKTLKSPREFAEDLHRSNLNPDDLVPEQIKWKSIFSMMHAYAGYVEMENIKNKNLPLKKKFRYPPLVNKTNEVR